MIEQNIPEIFQHREFTYPNNFVANISPSVIYKFFDLPRIWYEEELLYKDAKFQGNTGSTLGSICHHIYKCVTDNLPYSKEDILKQLAIYAVMKPELALDVPLIQNLFPLISSVVINEYVIPENTKYNISKNKEIIKSEVPLTVHFRDGIYLSGTCDRIEGYGTYDETIVDFKNVSTKPSEDTLSFSYKIQALAYAYIRKLLGASVSRIRIVYGVRPTIKLGARCIIVSEQITDNSWKLIEDTINLIVESILLVKKHPELTHIVFKSMDLKQG
jgi:hypothetical protein